MTVQPLHRKHQLPVCDIKILMREICYRQNIIVDQMIGHNKQKCLEELVCHLFKHTSIIDL